MLAVLGLRSLFFWISPSTAIGESYRYVDIHPPGWADSRVTCINGYGEAVGFGTTGSGERGFLWSAGTITEILPPGADSARAAWTNDSGDIAGTWEKGGVRHAFLLRGSTFHDPTPDWGTSEATYVGGTARWQERENTEPMSPATGSLRFSRDFPPWRAATVPASGSAIREPLRYFFSPGAGTCT